MVQGGRTTLNDQQAIAEGKGSLAINAAAYANVTVYQYVTYEGGKVTTRETTDPSECPYPGLETFRTTESEFFAGREEDVAVLEAKLKDHKVCGVIAASGAGKSSLVHAGLIPALAKRENEVWDVFAFKPGQEPLYGLARSMSGVLGQEDNLDAQLNGIRRNVENLRTTPGRLSEYVEDVARRRAGSTSGKRHRVLIFIDQWEELYTRENDADRDILVRELMEVTERGLAKVLLTMRIDFMEEMLLLSTDFFRDLKPGIHYVEPMDEVGLRAAIEVPAQKKGLSVPEPLTSRLIADLGNGRDHGSLPYLQFVLRQLWEKRDQDTNSLTIQAYDGMKGLKGAIGAHADAVFTKLTAEEQRLAKRVLPRLANVSESGAITSRRLPFADFDKPARQLLRKLAEPERRLIVLSSATEDAAEAEIVAEVAHEALLDDWATLSDWIADRKEFFRLRNKLEADAKTWIENDRRHDFLIPAGKPLFDAQDLYAKARNGDLSVDLKDFVEVSGRRRAKSRWLTLSALAATVVVALGAAFYFAFLSQELEVAVTEAEQTSSKLSAANLSIEAEQRETARALVAAEEQQKIAEVAQSEAQQSAYAEALARFQAEVRLSQSLASQGTSESWDVLVKATRDYVATFGTAVAFEAMDEDVLTVALQALISQRAFKPDELQGGSAKVITFSPDGSSLIVAQGSDLISIDPVTSGLRERFSNVGTPILHWPVSEHRVGLIVCSAPPCLFQTALLDSDNFGTVFLEYIGFDQTGFDFSEVTGRSDAFLTYMIDAMGSGIRDIEEPNFEAVREFEEDLALHALEDTIRGKLSVVVLNTANSEAEVFPIVECQERLCIGDLSGSTGSLSTLKDVLGELVGNLKNVDESFPVWLEEWELSQVYQDGYPPTEELDVSAGHVFDTVGANGTVVRTSFASSLVEIFLRSADGTWKPSAVCIAFNSEEGYCEGGMVGAIVLDVSDDGRLVLARSYNSGTGGGNGAQQTVLIDTTQGSVIWSSDTLSAEGAIAADNSAFAMIDVLGTLQIRTTRSFDLIYQHPEPIASESGIEFHPSLNLAVITERSGDIVLLDATPTTDLVASTVPLRSMRGMCQEINEVPFRSIFSASPRPLNSFDWAVNNALPKPSNVRSIRVPHVDGSKDTHETVLRPDGALFVKNEDQEVLLPNWEELVASAAPNMIDSDYLISNISSDENHLVIWNFKLYPELSEFNSLGVSHWISLANLDGSWKVDRTGSIENVESLASSNPIALATAREVSAESQGGCEFNVQKMAAGEQNWSGKLAFGLDVGLELYPADGTAVAISKEWYSTVSVQIFDLRTGAPGPWLNVTDDYWYDDQISDPEDGLVVRIPPWGDLLRQLLMDAANELE